MVFLDRSDDRKNQFLNLLTARYYLLLCNVLNLESKLEIMRRSVDLLQFPFVPIMPIISPFLMSRFILFSAINSLSCFLNNPKIDLIRLLWRGNESDISFISITDSFIDVSPPCVHTCEILCSHYPKHCHTDTVKYPFERYLRPFSNKSVSCHCDWCNHWIPQYNISIYASLQSHFIGPHNRRNEESRIYYESK